MNTDEEQNPCFQHANSVSHSLMTIYGAAKTGYVAVPTHLVNSISCPTNATLVIVYPGLTIRVKGRNLGRIFNLLTLNRLRLLAVGDELTHRFAPDDVFVSAIEVVDSK